MNTPYVFKVCSKCGELLPATAGYFYKKKTGKYGLHAECKKCHKKQKKKYYNKKREIILEQKREYRDNNRELIRERNKKYYDNNKNSIKKQRKEYRDNNRELIRERSKKYYDNNKNSIKKQRKEYYNEKREIILEQKRKYRQSLEGQIVEFNNHSKRRIKLENQGKGITPEQWREMMMFFSWKCAYSGENITKNNNSNGRTIDHIIPLDNEGLNEIWNVVPMKKGYNSSKGDRIDIMNWYKKQEYFSEERLKRILEWQQYAYDKWASEDDDPLILIIDLYDNRKEVM